MDQSLVGKVDNFLKRMDQKKKIKWHIDCKQTREWGRKNHCFICGKHSIGPVLERKETSNGVFIDVLNWDKPEGLVKCVKCGRWVCADSDHSYRGVCAKCAKNM